MVRIFLAGAVLGLSLISCGEDSGTPSSRGSVRDAPGYSSCTFVKEGFGPQGSVKLKVEKLVSGLEVPWAIGFLPGGDYLVTERPGRVRLVTGGALQVAPVLTLEVGEQGEGGLMGIAVDPRFNETRAVYVYYTAIQGGGTVNRLERYKLSEDRRSALLERTLIDGIPAGTFHNGGRLRFGPDGALYLATGDGREPERSQDAGSLAGKLLRISPDGGSPEIFLSGIRNSQGFDWWDDETLIVSDHGPSGELGLTGRDELSVARRGDNLGWPRITACGTRSGLVTPFVSWEDALPPGGMAVFEGALIPSFRDDILVTALGATHLQRVTSEGTRERYLVGEYGRLRDVIEAPDGSLWITTSNCDGRGDCGPDKDAVLRVTEG